MIARRSTGDILFDIGNYILMVLILILMVFPFIYIFNYSISDQTQISNAVIYRPVGINFDSYINVLSDPIILHSMFISVCRTVVGPALMVFFTSMAGYAVTKNDVLGIKWTRKFFVFTLYLTAGIIPTYILIKELHLIGTFWVYILPSIISVFNMILIKTYIESLPGGLEDSALIDGANEVQLFIRVIFPMCLPVMAAVTLFSCVQQWNAYVDTQFYNSMNPNLYPLQYVLFVKLQTFTTFEDLLARSRQEVTNFTPASIKMTVTVVTVLPILMIYPILQKYFIKGLLIGAIKG